MRSTCIAFLLLALFVLAGCEAPTSHPVLTRDAVVTGDLYPGGVLRVELVNEASELRYVRLSTGILFDGSDALTCPEATALVLLGTYADDYGKALEGAPLEAAASHSGARCPELLLAAPAGAVLLVEVTGLAGRAQPGSLVALTVEGLDTAE